MKNHLAIFLAGVIFALGLGVSGMTQPAKVVGFLDITGAWDPSLAFVMIGAIAVHTLAYRLVPSMKSPVLVSQFGIPSRTDITSRLIGGAVLFGLGWGLSGFCPGPALTSLPAGDGSTLLFVGAMLSGMAGVHFTDRLRHLKPTVTETA